MPDLLCFGELMLRLSTPDHLRFAQAQELRVNFGGAEANVAVTVAQLGGSAGFITKLPANELAERALADFFETVASGRNPKLAASWVLGDLAAALNRSSKGIEESPVGAAALGKLLDLIEDGTINGRIAKDVFEAMAESGKDPAVIVEEKGLRQVTDTTAIEAAIDGILAGNADKVAEFRAGREKLFGFFVGQTMKAMGGKGNPALINEILRQRLAPQ